MIYSNQVERHCLAGIIKHPTVFPEIDLVLKSTDFVHDVHETIFSVSRDILVKGEKLDKVLLAQKIKNLGVSFKDEIDIFDYIDSLAFTQITPEVALEAAQELLKFRIRREIADTGSKITKFANTCADKPIDEIITQSDAIYHATVGGYALSAEPENIFEGLEAEIEDRGNNPKEEVGLLTPFSEFNRLYGGFRNGNLYSIVARPGQGKSTWLNHMAVHTSVNNNCIALFLDTEMFTGDVKIRMVAALANVPFWYVETGNWRRNPEMVKRIRAALEKTKKWKYYHYFVGNKTVDQICSLIRRWYFNKVGRGNQCIICYDYLKLTGEKVEKNWAEYQAIGEKVDKLKKIGEEINAPILTAMQMNRSGENFNKKSGDVADDSSAIAMSDRLQWYASYTGIFRRKTLDEIAEDGEDFGTHKLITLKTRFQGKDAAGHQDILRRPTADGKFKYVNNYLNYGIENFSVNELGSLRHIIERQKEQYEINNPKEEGEIF